MHDPGGGLGVSIAIIVGFLDTAFEQVAHTTCLVPYIKPKGKTLRLKRTSVGSLWSE